MFRVLMTAAALVLGGTAPAAAQNRLPGEQSSRNMSLLAHIPLGGAQPLLNAKNQGADVMGNGRRTCDIEIEQELSRPYAYICTRFAPSGFYIVEFKDPKRARMLYHWSIENAELHRGSGALNPAYVKTRGRYYVAIATQFQQGGPDSDLGAVVFDVTGLPDTTRIKEVGRIRDPQAPGGFHESITYKHSTGVPMMITTSTQPFANLFDMEKFVAGDANQGLVGRVPLPDTTVNRRERDGVSRAGTFHDFYAGFDPVSKQDRLYGAGTGGYYVFDITDVNNPRLLTSITGISGVQYGHTFTPDPTGRYAVTEVEYRYAPLRIFDLKPGLDGTVKTISRPIGAWTANWINYSHNHEVRWPYVFVAAFEDGMQVFNMMDPTNPYTVGYYDTYDGPNGNAGLSPEQKAQLHDGNNGGWGVDIRNADGLIVLSDFTTGFWAMKMEGFDGWNGHQWGVPNISSAQDWDNGPEGAPKPQKVS